MKSILIILILFTIYSCQESIRDQLKEYKIGNQFVEITPVERLKYFMLINLSGLNSNQFGFLHDFKNKGIIFYDKNNLYKPYFIEHGDRVIKIDGTEIGEGISSSLETELLKINYIIVIGDKEEENKTLAVRQRGEKPKFGIKIQSFIEQLQKEISERI